MAAAKPAPPAPMTTTTSASSGSSTSLTQAAGSRFFQSSALSPIASRALPTAVRKARGKRGATDGAYRKRLIVDDRLGHLLHGHIAHPRRLAGIEHGDAIDGAVFGRHLYRELAMLAHTGADSRYLAEALLCYEQEKMREGNFHESRYRRRRGRRCHGGGRLRRLDEAAEIVVFERSGYISYANCGLPYYIGGTIADKSALTLQTPASFRARFNVDMRTRHEVEAIDAARHVVIVCNLETGEVFEEPYDKLILSPGARPTRPALPGVGLDRLFTLRTVEDTFAMKEFIDAESPRSAVVCGGGFIGLEVAENLRELGLDVTIVQRPRHLMNPFDADAAALIHQEMRAHGVRLALGRSAVGDAVQVSHLVTGDDALISLAGPANKQGRVAADVICGLNSRFAGAQGTSVIKVFDLTAAATGLSEAACERAGIAHDAVVLSPMSHAGYYPGGKVMTLKVVFERETYRLLGAQAIGYEGVDKRIDVLATALFAGLSAIQLKDLDLAYAPPYSSAKDPVNMAGFMVENLALGLVSQYRWDEVADLPRDGSVQLIDIRTPAEFERGALPGFRNIPLDELRERLGELDPALPVRLVCQSGLRSYVAARMLAGHGFTDVSHLAGGLRFYDIVTGDARLIERATPCGADAR